MPLILAVVFLVIPILEIAVLIQVGEQIGVLPTILLLIGLSAAGAVLAKREGVAVWKRLQEVLAKGELPSRELADGALILFGAALLLTPGFLTDLLGLTLLIPVTRAVVRGSLMKGFGWLAAKRFPILVPLGMVRSGPRKVKAKTVRTGPPDQQGDHADVPDDQTRISGDQR